MVKSHVNIYGDFRLGFDPISQFLGDNWIANKSINGAKKQHPSLDVCIHFIDQYKDFQNMNKIRSYSYKINT